MGEPECALGIPFNNRIPQLEIRVLAGARHKLVNGAAVNDSPARISRQLVHLVSQPPHMSPHQSDQLVDGAALDGASQAFQIAFYPSRSFPVRKPVHRDYVTGL